MLVVVFKIEVLVTCQCFMYINKKNKKKKRETIFKIMQPNTAVYFKKVLYMPTFWLMHDLLLTIYYLL